MAKSTIKAIIFDFFGVFRTDSYNAWLALHNLKREGVYAEIATSQDRGEITHDEFFVRLSELSGIPVGRDDFKALATFDKAVSDLADMLHRRYKTALLSNSPSNHLRKILAGNDLERHFDECIISSEVRLTKPDPAIFAIALERLSVSAAEAVFIDDQQKHVDAAAAIGIRSIRFESADQLEHDLAKLGVMAG